MFDMDALEASKERFSTYLNGKREELKKSLNGIKNITWSFVTDEEGILTGARACLTFDDAVQREKALEGVSWMKGISSFRRHCKRSILLVYSDFHSEGILENVGTLKD